MFELINTRRIGRMYHRFCKYIASIRCGENHIMMGEGYVVMSMEQYHVMLPKIYDRFNFELTEWFIPEERATNI